MSRGFLWLGRECRRGVHMRSGHVDARAMAPDSREPEPRGCVWCCGGGRMQTEAVLCVMALSAPLVVGCTDAYEMAGEGKPAATGELARGVPESSSSKRPLAVNFTLSAEIKHRRRAEAIRALQEHGKLRFGPPPPASRLSKLLGSQAPPDPPVLWVQLLGFWATDAALEHVGWIVELEILDLTGGTVTDAGLAHLRSLTSLGVLHLYGTSVTDAGLAHLRGLTKLRVLGLCGTSVTDAGLAHISGLTKLTYLDLASTRVMDAGLAHIGGLTRLMKLNLSV